MELLVAGVAGAGHDGRPGDPRRPGGRLRRARGHRPGRHGHHPPGPGRRGRDPPRPAPHAGQADGRRSSGSSPPPPPWPSASALLLVSLAGINAVHAQYRPHRLAEHARPTTCAPAATKRRPTRCGAEANLDQYGTVGHRTDRCGRHRAPLAGAARHPAAPRARPVLRLPGAGPAPARPPPAAELGRPLPRPPGRHHRRRRAGVPRLAGHHRRPHRRRALARRRRVHQIRSFETAPQGAPGDSHPGRMQLILAVVAGALLIPGPDLHRRRHPPGRRPPRAAVRGHAPRRRHPPAGVGHRRGGGVGRRRRRRGRSGSPSSSCCGRSWPPCPSPASRSSPATSRSGSTDIVLVAVGRPGRRRPRRPPRPAAGPDLAARRDPAGDTAGPAGLAGDAAGWPASPSSPTSSAGGPATHRRPDPGLRRRLRAGHGRARRRRSVAHHARLPGHGPPRQPPAALIAGRRLADNPRAAFRAVSGLIVALFISSAVARDHHHHRSPTTAPRPAARPAGTSWPRTSADQEHTTPDGRRIPGRGGRLRHAAQPSRRHPRRRGRRRHPRRSLRLRTQGPMLGPPTGLVACADLARIPALGRCPAGAAVASIPWVRIGRASPATTRRRVRLWPAAAFSADQPGSRCPSPALDVGTDGSRAAIERARTALEAAFPDRDIPEHPRRDQRRQRPADRRLAAAGRRRHHRQPGHRRLQPRRERRRRAHRPQAALQPAPAHRHPARRPPPGRGPRGRRSPPRRRRACRPAPGCSPPTSSSGPSSANRCSPRVRDYYLTVAAGLALALGIIASTLPCSERITGPKSPATTDRGRRLPDLGRMSRPAGDPRTNRSSRPRRPPKTWETTPRNGGTHGRACVKKLPGDPVVGVEAGPGADLPEGLVLPAGRRRIRVVPGPSRPGHGTATDSVRRAHQRAGRRERGQFAQIIADRFTTTS